MIWLFKSAFSLLPGLEKKVTKEVKFLPTHGVWKSHKKSHSTLWAPKILNLAIFQKRKACGQTVLPDRSLLIGKELNENENWTKIENWTKLNENEKLDKIGH